MKSRDYELLVREIYQQMLDQSRAANIAVQHNVQKQGLSTTHQIDVYWEFRLAEVEHRVIVQAKNWKKPVRKGDVLTFKGVLQDLPGTVGIMVTASGFQRGALEVAKAAGIIVCNLRKDDASDGIRMFPGETATIKITGIITAKDGTHMGMVTDVTQKTPQVNELKINADNEWHQARAPELQSLIEFRNYSLPIHFLDQDRGELIRLDQIFSEFYKEMYKSGEMSATKTRSFDQPTFLRLAGFEKAIKVNSESAKIVFESRVTQVHLKPKNVATFILKNIYEWFGPSHSGQRILTSDASPNGLISRVVCVGQGCGREAAALGEPAED